MQLERFGIFAPILGKRTNFPTQLLDDNATPVSQNVRTIDGEIHSVLGRAPLLVTPAWDDEETYAADVAVIYEGVTYTSDNLGNTTVPDVGTWTAVTVPNAAKPILHYHHLVTTGGSSYTFAFTEDCIYIWDNTNSYWRNHLGAYGDAAAIVLTATTSWSTCTFNNQVIATNGQADNPPLVGDETDEFVYLSKNASAAVHGLDLDGDAAAELSKAGFVVAFQGYVLVGDTTETDPYYNRLRYCAIGEHEDWDEVGSTAGFINIGDTTPINGAAVWGDYLIVFKDTSIWKVWLTADADVVFESAQISDVYGCRAPQSAVLAADGTMVFLASDMRIRTVDGEDISAQIDKVLREITEDAVGAVRAFRVERNNELWFSVPYGSGETANNRILTVAPGGVWNILLFAIPAFGRYERQADVTIDGLDAEFASIEEWSAAWGSIDAAVGSGGFVYDISADAAGGTWQLNATTDDKGAAFDAKFSLASDLTEGSDLITYKRLLRARLFVLRDCGTDIELYVRRDGANVPDYIGARTIPNATGEDSSEITVLDYPCRLRAKHFEFLIEAGNGAMRFLGIELEYTRDGVR